MTSAVRTLTLEADLRHVLSSETTAPALVQLRHDTGLLDHVLLPFDGFSKFYVTPMERPLNITGPGLKVRTEKRLLALSQQGETEKVLSKSRFAAPISHGGCIYTLDRPRSTTTRRDLSDYRGMDLGSESLTTLMTSQILLDETPIFDTEGIAPSDASNVAVILHLHYTELWPEFAQFLERSLKEFKLIVTINEENAELRQTIKTRFERSHILKLPNLGRDVWPFLKVLKSELLDDVELICKLHGKRSLLSGVSGSRYGHLWRRRNLCDLIGTPDQVSSILKRFAAVPKIGMLGSAPLRLPNGYGDDPGAKTARALREKFAQDLGYPQPAGDNDFFAGTMFWTRKEALRGLSRLDLSDADFEDHVNAQGDGLEHALERFFADAIRANGFQLGDVEPLTNATKFKALRSNSGRLTAPKALYLGPRDAFAEKWLIPPNLTTDTRVALIAAITPDGSLLEHTKRLMSSCRTAGYQTVLGIACPDPSTELNLRDIPADAVFLREVGGFHFSLWSAQLRSCRELWAVKEIAFCSDRIVGHIGALDRSVAKDGLAMFSSANRDPHFPTVLSLGPEALCKPSVQDFFDTALDWNKESETHHRYDRQLIRYLENACNVTIKRVHSTEVAQIAELDSLPSHWSQRVAGQSAREIKAAYSQRKQTLRKRYGVLFAPDL